MFTILLTSAASSPSLPTVAKPLGARKLQSVPPSLDATSSEPRTAVFSFGSRIDPICSFERRARFQRFHRNLSAKRLTLGAPVMSTFLAIVHIGIVQLHETLVSGKLREPVPSI